jgi:hypothetical protein
MSEKRKISTRKIVQTILTIVLLCACVFVVLSASKWQGEKRVMGVHIEIENEDYCQFVSKEEIQKILFEKRHIIYIRLQNIYSSIIISSKPLNNL